MANSDDFVRNLVTFFKTARHLWGRCPNCATPFRLSDVAISSSAETPRDWLRKLEREQAELLDQESELGLREEEVDRKRSELMDTESDLSYRERHLEQDARRRVREILQSKTEVRKLIRDANKAAVQKSRATLFGKLLERVAPCFRRFAYDPRDMRCICDPFDYVLFDGLTIERQVRKITFIEVKCGRGRMSSAQRSVHEAVEKGRVDAEVWQIGDPNLPITRQLSNGHRALPAATREE